MFRIFLPLLVLSISLTSSICGAAGVADASRWPEVQALFEAGKLEEAFQLLSAQPSGNDPIYFYNLGTIAYRLGKTGAALGYFEKANRLKRHDPDIHQNLELTRSDLIK